MTSPSVSAPSLFAQVTALGSQLATSVRNAISGSTTAKPEAQPDQYAGTPQQCRGIRDSHSAGPSALAECIRSALG